MKVGTFFKQLMPPFLIKAGRNIFCYSLLFRKYITARGGILVSLSKEDLKNKIVNLKTVWNIYRGRYETAEFNIINRADITGFTVLEIGGGLGVVTVQLAKKVGPNGKVIVLEPNVKVIEKLKKHLKLNNVSAEVINALLVDNNKEKHGTFIPGKSIESGRSDNYSSLISELSFSVATVSLREIMKEQHITLNLIVCDGEGAEYDLVNSLSDDINADLLMEIHPTILGNEKHKEMLVLLENKEYFLSDLVPSGKHYVGYFKKRPLEK